MAPRPPRRGAGLGGGPPISEANPPGESRPADECPYRRPFADDFDDCPVYTPQRFVPFDSLHRPLHPIWTCNFLAPKRAGDRAHGYYACCGLGDAAARVAWVEAIRRDRFDQVLSLRKQTAEVVKPRLVEIYAAKSRQLDGGGNRQEATNELERLLRLVEADIFSFIDQHATEFEAASLPVEPVKQLMTLTIRDMVERKDLGSQDFTPPQALLEQFPAEVRPILMGGAAQPEPGADR